MAEVGWQRAEEELGVARGEVAEVRARMQVSGFTCRNVYYGDSLWYYWRDLWKVTQYWRLAPLI